MKISHLLAQAALVLSLACFAGPAALANPAEPLDTVPRAAIISAFQPEWTALQAALRGRKDFSVNGTTFATGTIEGRPVVLFLSGISMVNASMTAQLALDRFNIDKIVFSLLNTSFALWINLLQRTWFFGEGNMMCINLSSVLGIRGTTCEKGVLAQRNLVRSCHSKIQILHLTCYTQPTYHRRPDDCLEHKY